MVNGIERKIMKEVMNDIKLKRMPRSFNRVKPIFAVCGKCKKRPVTNHHFKCNKCWNEDNKDKGSKLNFKGKEK